MRAALLTETNGPLHVVADHPAPSAPEGGLVLDVTACGVCHSDLHVVDGHFGKAPPIILGHEVTGIHPDMGEAMLYAPHGDVGPVPNASRAWR